METKEKRTGSEELKQRHRKRVRRRNISIAVSRLFIAALICVVTLTVVLYLNPMFNIKQVIYEGNSRISKDYLDEYCQNLIGENLFHVSKKSVMELFEPINYIADLKVEKKYFPPIVRVVITEAKPYGCAKIGDRYIMFDKNLKNLEESSSFIEGAPKIYGIEEVPIEDFKKDSKNKTVNAVMETLDAMNKTGVLDHVGTVSFKNISSITFDYDGKYDVTLGSAFDVESKLQLFLATISSADVAENTGGTIDLSTGGTAYYRP